MGLVRPSGRTGVTRMAVTHNIMKTKLYSVILLAVTLAGSGFSQATKPAKAEPK